MFTLLTNMQFIQYDQESGLRLNCAALLITDNPIPEGQEKPLLHTEYSLRGFGPDPAWETFNLFLEKDFFPWELQGGIQDRSRLMITDDQPEGKPIFQGALLKFANGRKLFIQTADDKRPVDRFEHTDINHIWAALERNVPQYWLWPNMPTLVYVPADMVRAGRI